MYIVHNNGGKDTACTSHSGRSQFLTLSRARPGARANHRRPGHNHPLPLPHTSPLPPQGRRRRGAAPTSSLPLSPSCSPWRWIPSMAVALPGSLRPDPPRCGSDPPLWPPNLARRGLPASEAGGVAVWLWRRGPASAAPVACARRGIAGRSA